MTIGELWGIMRVMQKTHQERKKKRLIHLENVTKVYPNGTHAVRNLTLDIPDGEFVFIVGPSGAGKSTLLKLLIREEVADNGIVEVNGKNLMTMPRRQVPYLRRTMGIVFQDFRLIDKMTVFDNVAFAMRVTGHAESTIRKRVPLVLRMVGLSDKAKRNPHELSGGEQQRVSLARAIINRPALLIADEPTGNIDPERSVEIMKMLFNIHQKGTTVIVVTHEHELVRQFGGRVLRIEEGKITADVVLPMHFPNGKKSADTSAKGDSAL